MGEARVFGETLVTVAQIETVVANAMTACAKAWLPDNPAHIAEAANWLACLQKMEEDPTVAVVLKGVVERLKKNAPSH